jgi:hypothetical protein
MAVRSARSNPIRCAPPPFLLSAKQPLTVLTTVLNNRFPGRLTTDAGAKALTLNTPTAGVIGEPGMEYNAGSDEFGGIRFTSPPSKDYMQTTSCRRCSSSSAGSSPGSGPLTSFAHGRSGSPAASASAT